MTNQELFDKVAVHLLTQNERSLFGDKVCVYYGEGALRCAIGCLMPEELYSRELEGCGLGNPRVAKAAGLEPQQLGLASRLQIVHDQVKPPSWAINLRAIAAKEGLNTAAIDRQEP